VVQVGIAVEVEGTRAEDVLLQDVQPRLGALEVRPEGRFLLLQDRAAPAEAHRRLLEEHLVAPQHLSKPLQSARGRPLGLLERGGDSPFSLPQLGPDLGHLRLGRGQLGPEFLDALLSEAEVPGRAPRAASEDRGR
jgi:hypothetical protein